MRIGLTTALAVALPFAAIFIILLFALVKSLRQKVTTGDQGMVGLVGTADTEVHRNGRVKVRGEYWAARSGIPVAPGRPVKVKGIKDLVLEVEELKE